MYSRNWQGSHEVLCSGMMQERGGERRDNPRTGGRFIIGAEIEDGIHHSLSSNTFRAPEETSQDQSPR
jgi:hypothetical protein